jgi:hypothetical protein
VYFCISLCSYINPDQDITECNVGTENDPKYIKLSRSLSEKKIAEYTRLLKEFVDLFTWTYEDLRTYDTSILENKIPLKENTKLLGKS